MVRLIALTSTHIQRVGCKMADKFTKGVMSDQSGKVMPFPTIDRVQFYREHMSRSMISINEMYMQLQAIQDMLYAEVIEFENCALELSEEIQRLQRLFEEEEKRNNNNG